MESTPLPVVVVGGGLAGMRCAQITAAAGMPVTLVESQDRLGGRVQTDEVDGFLLDRGFQVLLTEYAEARKTFDYDDLNLKHFDAGALVRMEGRFIRIADPFRSPVQALQTLSAPVGSLRDKLRILLMRSRLTKLSTAELLDRPERTTLDALTGRWRFSQEAVERFFRPFFGGILLDKSLRGSSRMMEYVFQMFGRGYAAVPSGGMGHLAAQLAAGLQGVTVRTGTPAASVEGSDVILKDGSRIHGRAIVVATDGPASNRLLGARNSPDYVGAHCYYFAADTAPMNDPVLILNGDGQGPVNNVAILSNVAPSYSATGESLISVTALTEHGMSVEPAESSVRSQLMEWFGQGVRFWRHVRTYHIPTALPDQSPPFLTPVEKRVRLGEKLYRCGDYVDTASINGALRSGRRAAQAVIHDLAR